MQVLNRAALIFLSVIPMALFCICGGENAFYIAAAVAFHELGHLAALKITHGKIKGFRAAPFGLCIDYDRSELSLFGEALVSFGGCFFNILCALLVGALYMFFSLDMVVFGLVSLLYATVNLLPLYPLDGYTLLNAILSALFDPYTADRISFFASYVIGFSSFLVASYLMLTEVTGIYPLLFSAYIFSSNAKISRDCFEF
nr:hypothetical protein [Clostridia bacterium]